MSLSFWAFAVLHRLWGNQFWLQPPFRRPSKRLPNPKSRLRAACGQGLRAPQLIAEQRAQELSDVAPSACRAATARRGRPESDPTGPWLIGKIRILRIGGLKSDGARSAARSRR